MAAKTLQESNFQEFIQEFKDVQQPTNNIPCLKIQGPKHVPTYRYQYGNLKFTEQNTPTKWYTPQVSPAATISM